MHLVATSKHYGNNINQINQYLQYLTLVKIKILMIFMIFIIFNDVLPLIFRLFYDLHCF